MTPSISDLEVTYGPTWRKTVIGETVLTVWTTRDGSYMASMLRGDIVKHPRLPANMHDLDRAFEHAVALCIDAEAEHIAAIVAFNPDGVECDHWSCNGNPCSYKSRVRP